MTETASTAETTDISVKDEIALQVIETYLQFVNFLEINNFDHSDFYSDRIGLVKEIRELGGLALLDKLEDNLLNICEDNEVMKVAIEEHFAEYEEDEDDD